MPIIKLKAMGGPMAQEPDEPAGWLDLAQQGLDEGDLDGALEAYDRYLAVCPQDLDVRTYRVQVLWQFENYAEAISEALATIRLADQSSGDSAWENLPLLHLLMARSQVASDQPEAAVESYSSSLKLAPQQPTVYLERAEQYIELELFNRAIQDCRTVLLQDRHNAEAFRLGAIASWRKHQPDLAMALAQKAIDLGSESARGLLAAWIESADQE